MNARCINCKFANFGRAKNKPYVGFCTKKDLPTLQGAWCEAHEEVEYEPERKKIQESKRA